MATLVTNPKMETAPNQTLENVAEEVISGMFCHYEPPENKKQKRKGILRTPRMLHRNNKATLEQQQQQQQQQHKQQQQRNIRWSDKVEASYAISPTSDVQCNVVTTCVEGCVEAGIVNSPTKQAKAKQFASKYDFEGLEAAAKAKQAAREEKQRNKKLKNKKQRGRDNNNNKVVAIRIPSQEEDDDDEEEDRDELEQVGKLTREQIEKQQMAASSIQTNQMPVAPPPPPPPPLKRTSAGVLDMCGVKFKCGDEDDVHTEEPPMSPTSDDDNTGDTSDTEEQESTNSILDDRKQKTKKEQARGGLIGKDIVGKSNNANGPTSPSSWSLSSWTAEGGEGGGGGFSSNSPSNVLQSFWNGVVAKAVAADNHNNKNTASRGPVTSVRSHDDEAEEEEQPATSKPNPPLTKSNIPPRSPREFDPITMLRSASLLDGEDAPNMMLKASNKKQPISPVKRLMRRFSSKHSEEDDWVDNTPVQTVKKSEKSSRWSLSSGRSSSSSLPIKKQKNRRASSPGPGNRTVSPGRQQRRSRSLERKTKSHKNGLDPTLVQESLTLDKAAAASKAGGGGVHPLSPLEKDHFLAKLDHSVARHDHTQAQRDHARWLELQGKLQPLNVPDGDAMERQSFITANRHDFGDGLSDADAKLDDMMERQSFITASREDLDVSSLMRLQQQQQVPPTQFGRQRFITGHHQAMESPRRRLQMQQQHHHQQQQRGRSPQRQRGRSPQRQRGRSPSGSNSHARSGSRVRSSSPHRSRSPHRSMSPRRAVSRHHHGYFEPQLSQMPPHSQFSDLETMRIQGLAYPGHGMAHYPMQFMQHPGYPNVPPSLVGQLKTPPPAAQMIQHSMSMPPGPSYQAQMQQQPMFQIPTQLQTPMPNFAPYLPPVAGAEQPVLQQPQLQQSTVQPTPSQDKPMVASEASAPAAKQEAKVEELKWEERTRAAWERLRGALTFDTSEEKVETSDTTTKNDAEMNDDPNDKATAVAQDENTTSPAAAIQQPQQQQPQQQLQQPVGILRNGPDKRVTFGPPSEQVFYNAAPPNAHGLYNGQPSQQLYRDPQPPHGLQQFYYNKPGEDVIYLEPPQRRKKKVFKGRKLLSGLFGKIRSEKSNDYDFYPQSLQTDITASNSISQESEESYAAAMQSQQQQPFYNPQQQLVYGAPSTYPVGNYPLMQPLQQSLQMYPQHTQQQQQQFYQQPSEPALQYPQNHPQQQQFYQPQLEPTVQYPQNQQQQYYPPQQQQQQYYTHAAPTGSSPGINYYPPPPPAVPPARNFYVQ